MKKITQKLIKKFQTFLVNEEKSKSTVEKYIRDITFFQLWLGEKPLNKNTILEYKAHITKHYAPASVNSIISSLNSFFTYCEWYELKLKALKIQRKIFSDKDCELSREDYDNLLIAAKKENNIRLYHIIQTLGSTGIRISELQHITVEAVIKKQATINCKGKMRVIILPKELCKMLRAYAKEKNIYTGSIFVTKNGKPLDRSNIWKQLKNLCQKANVSKCKVYPHSFRHFFARCFYTAQKDIVRLADILGHSSVNTTRIYTMENSDVHREQVEMLGLLNIIKKPHNADYVVDGGAVSCL